MQAKMIFGPPFSFLTIIIVLGSGLVSIIILSALSKITSTAGGKYMATPEGLVVLLFDFLVVWVQKSL